MIKHKTILKGLQRTGKNLLVTSLTLLIANVSNHVLRKTSKNTIEELTMDIKRIRTDINDRQVNAIPINGIE